MTSASETGTDIIDQREPIEVPYDVGDLIYPSDLMAIIEIDICKHHLPTRIMNTVTLTKLVKESPDSDVTTADLL